MRSILVDKKFVDLKSCSYGFPWDYDANCYNFKIPTEFVLNTDVHNITNPLEITTIVLGCDFDNYDFISKMTNLRQLYIYSGKNIVNLDFIKELINLNHIYISESGIIELDGLVELLKMQKSVREGLTGMEKVLFGLEAICVKSSEELKGEQLLVQGMYVSGIIVNNKWIRR